MVMQSKLQKPVKTGALRKDRGPCAVCGLEAMTTVCEPGEQPFYLCVPHLQEYKNPPKIPVKVRTIVVD